MLGFQLKTVRLSGAYTIDLIKTLLDTAHKLSEDVAVLKSDNASLKSQINKLREKACQPQGSLSSRVGLLTDKEIADPSSAAPLRNPARSYASVAISGPAHTVSPSKEFADRGITLDAASAVPSSKLSTAEEDSDGFKTVTYRKKTTMGAPAVVTVKHRHMLLNTVRNSASLPSVSKKERFKALFVSRFSPEVTADDVEKPLKEQLSLQMLVFTRLKAKFKTYASCFGN
jgi:hypothetical protein